MRSVFQYILALLSAICLWSCNTDNDPVFGNQDPIRVIFDNPAGVYEVKTGKTITITPVVENAANPRYKWIDDQGKTVASGLGLTFSSPDEGTFYFTFCVDADNGSAQEDIRIDVLAKSIPTVTLPTEMSTTVGQTLTIEPAVSTGGDENATYLWTLDGIAACSEKTFSFKAQREGIYRLKLTVSNEDGSASAEMEIRATSVPQLSVCFPKPLIETISGRAVCLAPAIRNASGEVSYKWSVNGSIITGANDPTYEYTPTGAGISTVSIDITSGDVSAKASVEIHCLSTTEDERFRPATASSSRDQIKVYEFMPAPGQFVHQIRSTDMTDACLEAERRLKAKQEVSLGAFGGYIVVGFDHSVASSDGDYDFAIAGNSFRTSNEPGIVWVMQDENGNGLPDDTWYELRGSETDSDGTLYGYSVTYYRPSAPGSPIVWADSENQTGTLTVNPTYPSWQTGPSYTLSGTRLQARTIFTTEWENQPYAWGYTDNLGSDRISDSENMDGATNYNYFKIANAISASRKPVRLRYIDFIKVQCGVNAKAGILGEVSTEVFGFLDCGIR